MDLVGERHELPAEHIVVVNVLHYEQGAYVGVRWNGRVGDLTRRILRASSFRLLDGSSGAWEVTPLHAASTAFFGPPLSPKPAKAEVEYETQDA